MHGRGEIEAAERLGNALRHDGESAAEHEFVRFTVIKIYAPIQSMHQRYVSVQSLHSIANTQRAPRTIRNTRHTLPFLSTTVQNLLPPWASTGPTAFFGQ